MTDDDETSPIPKHLVEESFQEAKDTKARRWVLALTVVAALLAVFTVYAATRTATDPRVDELQAAVESNAGVAQALASQVKGLGETPVVEPPPAPASAIPTVVPQPPSAEAIQTAVDQYLIAHPPVGAKPTLPEITQAVGAVLATNPPVTTAEISQAVATYVAANPPPSGQPGKDGQPGPGPTDDQVAAAVAAYCGTADQLCKGDPGVNGTNGTNGTNGADGQDGKPPVTQTFFINGQMYQCDRDADSPDDAPTYHCGLQVAPTSGGN